MLDVLAKTPLFRGIVRDDIRVVLKSLCAHEKSYRKGEIIVQAGATTRECGVVVRGAAVIEHGDIWGNVSIMGVIEVGVNFALPYACLGSEPLPFTVVGRLYRCLGTDDDAPVALSFAFRIDAQFARNMCAS